MYRQDELCLLETTLSKLDKEHEATNPYRLSARRYDEAQPDGDVRKDLMRSIDEKLKQYDDLLQRESTILSMPKASRQNHRSLFNYIWNEQPLSAEEQEFILYKDDFVTLLSEDEGWLDFLMQALFAFFPLRFLNVSYRTVHILYVSVDVRALTPKSSFYYLAGLQERNPTVLAL